MWAYVIMGEVIPPAFRLHPLSSRRPMRGALCNTFCETPRTGKGMNHVDGGGRPCTCGLAPRISASRRERVGAIRRITGGTQLRMQLSGVRGSVADGGGAHGGETAAAAPRLRKATLVATQKMAQTTGHRRAILRTTTDRGVCCAARNARTTPTSPHGSTRTSRAVIRFPSRERDSATHCRGWTVLPAPPQWPWHSDVLQ